MDLSHGPSRRHCPGGADHISFLSDDMILLILARLHCVRTAVGTGLLSRRWRGLWTRLTDLAFRGVPPATIEAAFSLFNAASPAGTAFQLDIRLPSKTQAIDANSLLRAVALFSPARLVFTIAPSSRDRGLTLIQLPCFQHATSIEVDMQQFAVEPPAAGEFSALERLSISGKIVHIGAWVTRCPRLRVLRAKLRGFQFFSLRLELGSLKDALGSRGVALSLDISIYDDPDVSLLIGVACLSPQELVYTTSEKIYHSPYTRYLPCFHRATSIEIDMPNIIFTPPLHGEFSALERLCLFHCNIVNLGKFISCCPRLRVLRVDSAMSMSKCDITVHSTSLQELVLGTYKDCCGINIVTPELKQLTMKVHARRDVGTSVLAPLLEKVSWRHSYTWRPPLVFGFWLLQSLSLQTTTSNGERVLTENEEDGTWLSVQQLPPAHVLSMSMCASDTFKQDPSSANLNFAREINNFAVTEFSVVHIRLEAMGHVYGATMFHLLQALQVHSATKVLKVNLIGSETPEDPEWSETSEVTRACKKNCLCEESKNWRRQSISLHYLEEVEIKGFTGESHGFAFLKLIFRCAPKLKKVTIKLAKRMKSFVPQGCAKKIYRISLAYPYVDFYVHLDSGRLVPDP